MEPEIKVLEKDNSFLESSMLKLREEYRNEFPNAQCMVCLATCTIKINQTEVNISIIHGIFSYIYHKNQPHVDTYGCFQKKKRYPKMNGENHGKPY